MNNIVEIIDNTIIIIDERTIDERTTILIHPSNNYIIFSFSSLLSNVELTIEQEI